jgi:hypothetical protein
VHKNPAAFSFLQSDNQKKEEGYPIARKKKTMQPVTFLFLQ